MFSDLAQFVINGSIANHAAEVVASIVTGVLISSHKIIEAKISNLLGNPRAQAGLALGAAVRDAIADGSVDSTEVLEIVEIGKRFKQTW